MPTIGTVIVKKSNIDSMWN